MSNFAIGFCLYNPNKSFFERLNFLRNAGIATFIYDNSKDSFFDSNLSNTASFHHDPLNSGLGYGMHWILKEAFQNNFKYVIYFDQDTLFSMSTISFLKNFLLSNKFTKNFSSIQVKGVDSISKNINLIYTTRLQINSGTIFNLDNMSNIGFHDKSFFIDGVDYSHCLNSLIKGYNLGVVYGAPDFDHDTEQGYDYYRFFGFYKGVRKYSSARMFDYFISSIRLLFKSLVFAQFIFFCTCLKLLFLYFLDQLFVRLFKISASNG